MAYPYTTSPAGYWTISALRRLLVKPADLGIALAVAVGANWDDSCPTWD